MQAAWVNNQWTASSDSCLDPGWMLPIVVLSRVYSSFLNTAPDAHIYRAGKPLPLDELHSTDRPDAGLLALLKFALWQVLWVEASSSGSSMAMSAHSCLHMSVARTRNMLPGFPGHGWAQYSVDAIAGQLG